LWIGSFINKIHRMSGLDDSTSPEALQDAGLGESWWVPLASKCHKASAEFGWPVLLLFLAGPAVPRVTPSELYLYAVLGLPAILLGLGLRLWSRGYARGEGFVWDGPYRYVRNPVESGALFIYGGAATLLQLPWWYNMICLTVSLIYLNFSGLHYEREIFLKLGAPFLRYKQRVRRWIPSSLPGANRTNRSYTLLHALYNERHSAIWIVAYAVIFGLRRHFRTY
jgi:protein-S-isoprenylcysteine O-methyltransferase Ste14